MSKKEYINWISESGANIYLINIPAILRDISLKCMYVTYNLKGRLSLMYDNYLMDHLNFVELEFSHDAYQAIWAARNFIEVFQKNHPDFSEHDFEKILPNPATLVFMDCFKNINQFACAKEIAYNRNKLNNIMERLFGNGGSWLMI